MDSMLTICTFMQIEAFELENINACSISKCLRKLLEPQKV